MTLDEIYEPIKNDILAVKAELKNLAHDLASNYSEEIFNHFFNSPGKYLRPALVLLSARAVNENITGDLNTKLIKMASAFELIHGASLVHDDIIDSDFLRRGQETLNNLYGNKIAVLSGDILFTRAFSIFVDSFPKDFAEFMLQIAERMCASEVEQAGFDDEFPTRDSYLKMITGKTGLLMSAACRLGAKLATEKNEDYETLEKFGFNFGIRYQIIDDLKDNDPIAKKHIIFEDAQQFGVKAKDAVANLKESVYKRSLIDMANLNFN